MKKLALILTLVLAIGLTACSKEEKKDSSDKKEKTTNESTSEKKTNTPASLSLEEAIVQMEASLGISIDRAEKPLFQMIGAKDGIIFNVDGDPVKIYEYADEAAYEAGMAENPDFKAWPKKGLLVLETNNQSAIDAFNGLTAK